MNSPSPSARPVMTSCSRPTRSSPATSEQLAEVRWARLVLDEAQQVKNPGTAQARAVRSLEAGRRIAMTGTPVENRLAELWSLMHVLNPGLLGTARSFRDRFAAPIERDGDDRGHRAPPEGDGTVHPPPVEDGQDDHQRSARTRSR